jgi:hypothetical protein
MTCATCVEGKCAPRTKANCCGNGKCDLSETVCTCADCGTLCKSPSKYFSAICPSQKECVYNISWGSVTKESETTKVTLGASTLTLTATYDSPFMLGYSKLNIKMKPDILENAEYKFKRINIFERVGYNGQKPLASIDTSQILYGINTEINEDFILNIERNNTNSKEVYEVQKNIFVEFIYEKKGVDLIGNPLTTQSSFSKDFSKPLKIVVMANSTCPDSCDDKNPCTIDSCEEVFTYNYCVHDYMENCCGNKICDEGENKCGCFSDCGKCDYNFGTYLRYSCSPSNKCEPSIKDNVLERITKKFASSDLADFTFDIKLQYNQPFSTEDSLNIDLTLKSMNAVTDAVIKSIELYEGQDKLIVESVLNEPIMAIGDTRTYSLKPSISFTSSPERAFAPKLVINFEYTGKDYTGKDKRYMPQETITLDSITFVDT